MQTQPHGFIQPDDPETPIWRYMDFAKFVAMLEAGGLFMCRADQLGDPFEGTISARTGPASSRSFAEQGAPAAVLPHLVEIQRQQARNYRQWITVNCWHINQTESAAMWRLYAKSADAVCIRSRFSTLMDVTIDDAVFAGCVRYVDFSTTAIPQGNVMWPFMHKRLSFAHEHEVRLISMKLMDQHKKQFNTSKPGDHRVLGYKPPPVVGWTLPADLHTLIEHVYVSPDAPDWFLALVSDVCVRYGLPVRAHRSIIGEDAFL